ncbi:MAG: DUF2946 family protein [Rhizomicrobium sp.]
MQHRFHCAAVAVALAAMVLRALLPMGWMPNPAGFGQSPLIICLMDSGAVATSSMAMSKSMDMKGGTHHGQQNGEACPFAAAPHLAPSAMVAAAAEPRSAEATRFPRAPVARQHGPAFYSPQSPRAPPSFA